MLFRSTPAVVSEDVNTETPVISEPIVPSLSVQESISSPELNVQSVSENIVSTHPEQIVEQSIATTPAPVANTVVTENVAMPNPQIEKLAVVSDPSLGISMQQPNVLKNKKAGFANTKYIVVGSVCLALAIATVVTAYILITNM